MGDIRIRCSTEFRKRVKTVKAEEGLTYAELLDELLDLREENMGAWENRHAEGRRPTGRRKR